MAGPAQEPTQETKERRYQDPNQNRDEDSFHAKLKISGRDGGQLTTIRTPPWNIENLDLATELCVGHVPKNVAVPP